MINIKNLSKTFTGQFKPVLENINLQIKPGEFCVLIGNNGSGKSTLLKLINGEYKADSGTISGVQSVAQVVQDVNIGTVPDLSLLENIALAETNKPKLLFYNRYKKTIIHKLKTLNIGLDSFINTPLKMLSGGQRQIIATLMALNANKKILLLDEHTSALDPKMQHLLMEYTAKQAAINKLTVFMITHKMEDAIKYGERLILLSQGKVRLDLKAEAMRKLTVKDLLKIFHKHADEALLAGDNYEL